MTGTEPISWKVAERVATRIAGREPFSSSYLATSMHADFEELTRQAEALVGQETGLQAAGPAKVRVTDRVGWVHANLASFRRLLKPLTDRLSDDSAKNGFFASAGKQVTGAQIGAVLGWMSTRVLGQYDLLLLEDERPEDQDMIYYVGANALALEKRYAFPPKEFRFWLALHECTHRAQFTGVPWLPEYFRSQVSALLSDIDPDSKRLSKVVRQVLEDVRNGKNPVADGGMLELLATPKQQEALQRIQALMALLEGHGEVTMARAGGDAIPSADRFHRVLHHRRANAKGISKVLQRLLGLESKLRQYAQGEKFIHGVEREGGPDLLKEVWKTPERLPTYQELSQPEAWVARMRALSETP